MFAHSNLTKMPAKPYVFGTFGGGGGGGALAFGAATRGADFGAASSITYSSPSVSGSNTLGVVALYTAGNSTITGVTWNGSAMTLDAGATIADSGIGLKIFYIIAPTAGVTDVVVTASVAWSVLFAEAMYLTGAHQTTPIDTSGNLLDTSGPDGSFSGTATTNNANEFVVDQVVGFTAGNFSVVGPSVLNHNGNNGADGWASSYQSVAAAGSPTMAWTYSASSFYLWNWISIKPA
jgi:hypothetical protein